MKFNSTKIFLLYPMMFILMLIIGCSKTDEGQKTVEEQKTVEFVEKLPDKVKSSELKRTKITSHFEAKIDKYSNLVYCSTFQLAWNELKTQVNGDVQLKNAPPSTAILNKSEFKKEYLDEKDYVAKFGKASEIIESINKELKQKFPKLNHTFNPGNIPPLSFIAYSFLYKNLRFDEEFENIIHGLPFIVDDKISTPVQAFGIDKYSEQTRLWKQVKVWYYDEKEVVIELLTKSKDDELILAMFEPEESLKKTYEKAEELRKRDNIKNREIGFTILKIPNIAFFVDHQYKEFIGKVLVNKGLKGWIIIESKQDILFRLNRRGALLKSEAFITGTLGSRIVGLYFCRPFLIYMKKKDSSMPYFALWVGNTELMKEQK